MRKMLIITIGLFCVNLSNAQDTVNFFKKRNEINIGFLNILSLNSTSTFGIGYKVRIKNNALRARLSFNYIKDKSNSSAQSYDHISTSFIPELGYEFRLNFKHSLVFYGLDLCGNFYNYENVSSSNTSSYKQSKNGYGISPFLGFKYFINKNISISTETSFDFLYIKENSENIYSTGNGTSSSYSSRETINAQLSPLGTFSIDFHF